MGFRLKLGFQLKVGLLLVVASMGGGDEGFRGGYFILGVVGCNL